MSSKSRPKSKIDPPPGETGPEIQALPLTPVGWAFVIALVAAVCILVWLQLAGPNSGGTRTQRLTAAAPRVILAAPVAARIEASAKNPSTLEIPLATLAMREARHFEYSMEQGPVRFFLVRTSDTQVRAAIDECTTCDEQLGYVQSREWMYCRSCDKGVPIDLVGELSGECTPIHLHSTVHDGQVVIAVNSLVSAAKRAKDDGG